MEIVAVGGALEQVRPMLAAIRPQDAFLEPDPTAGRAGRWTAAIGKNATRDGQEKAPSRESAGGSCVAQERGRLARASLRRLVSKSELDGGACVQECRIDRR
jgi:hypothetical protein